MLCRYAKGTLVIETTFFIFFFTHLFADSQGGHGENKKIYFGIDWNTGDAPHS
ncbi:MAG: hypothetical protein V1904_13150 [Bacteroidota bacterium]